MNLQRILYPLFLFLSSSVSKLCQRGMVSRSNLGLIRRTMDMARWTTKGDLYVSFGIAL